MPQPYKVTPIFDELSLPGGLRRDHSTKEKVWGVIRILEGRLRLLFSDDRMEEILEPGRPGLIRPAELHRVEPLGRMRMQVEFYDEPPTRPPAPAAPAAAIG